MKTAIVAIKPGYLAVTEDGWYLYEVDKDLIIDVNRSVGVHELQNCRSLNEVRAVVERKPYGG
jgi:hypothetical protein